MLEAMLDQVVTFCSKLRLVTGAWREGGGHVLVWYHGMAWYHGSPATGEMIPNTRLLRCTAILPHLNCGRVDGTVAHSIVSESKRQNLTILQYSAKQVGCHIAVVPFRFCPFLAVMQPYQSPCPREEWG